ncbi:response regulator transcription factor [Burkholderia thailandensis]|uniref:response regulator transcription factor n=1 Tax=Burkholderia thailandensis TaxID=57975 RepID=UPI000492874C|nr:response regulator transcription factor [Burkholderia thailandensis]AJT48705.1 histidine kinase [Burkholderia thailandensis]AOI52682.1 helix-turn-helix transcriptional regulator [Burkholderia thailandensis]
MGKFSVRTIFANDRPLSLAGMEYISTNANAIKLIGICRTSDELIAALSTAHCDVALVDYAIHGNGKMEGLALLGYLRRTFPSVGIVALVTNVNPVIVRSILSKNVGSVVSKFDDVGHIVTAIHACYAGANYLSPKIRRSLEVTDTGGKASALKLSPREAEVIRLYLSGLPVNKIAEQLKKGKQTISAQKVSAMKKLGVNNDVELIRCATRLDLIDEASASRFESQ